MCRILITLTVCLFIMGVCSPHGGLGWASAALAAEEHEGGGKEKDEKGPHPEFEYIQLDPIFLPVITTKGLTQEVRLMVQLEVEYGKRGDIEPYEPRLVDAYLQDLYGALGAGHGIMQNNVIDVVQVKQRLTAITDKVLGADHKAHGVLLQVLQQHSMN